MLIAAFTHDHMPRCLVLAIAIGLISSCALAEVKPPKNYERSSSWHTVLIPAPADELEPAGTGGIEQRHTAPAITTTKRPAPIVGFAHALEGLASYYCQGHQTSSGEPYDRYALTAAHRTLPFGTKVRVTNLDNGLSVVVIINDRGPFKAGRVIDLSEAAAFAIAMTAGGIARVRLELVR
jgi:rare lipoprotein A